MIPPMDQMSEGQKAWELMMKINELRSLLWENYSYEFKLIMQREEGLINEDGTYAF